MSDSRWRCIDQSADIEDGVIGISKICFQSRGNRVYRGGFSIEEEIAEEIDPRDYLIGFETSWVQADFDGALGGIIVCNILEIDP